MREEAGPVVLLDVNVLIALFDPGHLHHDASHAWFGSDERREWATCPLTQNGFVRVLANPAYGGRRTTVADAVGRGGALATFDGNVRVGAEERHLQVLAT